MKTKIFTMNSLLAGLFVFASCGSDEKAIDNPVQTTDEPNTVGIVTAMASVPQVADTKLALTESSNKLAITWEDSGEQFAILKGAGSVTAAQFDQGAWVTDGDKHSAYFNGSISLNKVDDYYAIYPYSIASGSQTAQSISLDMTGQTGTALDKTKVYMYDKKQYSGGNTFEFKFQHLTCIFKPTLQFPADVKIIGTQSRVSTTDEVSNVTFLADAGLYPKATANLTGTVSYSGTNDAMALSGTFSLTADADGNPCTTVYLHMIPTSLTNFLVVAQVGDKMYSASLTPKENPLVAGNLYVPSNDDGSVKQIEMTEGIPASALGKVDISTCKDLKVTGDLTSDAYAAILSWKTTARTCLDLSEAHIVAGATYSLINPGGNTTNVTTTANTVPTLLFYKSYIATVILPNDATEIKSDVFYNSGPLTEVVIPEGVANIGSNAFFACTGLKTIICNATGAPSINSDNTFSNVTKSNVTVYIPKGCTSSYTTTWGSDFTYVEKQ